MTEYEFWKELQLNWDVYLVVTGCLLTIVTVMWMHIRSLK